MDYTDKLKLHKPTLYDMADIRTINKNMDIIDGAIGGLPNQVVSTVNGRHGEVTLTSHDIEYKDGVTVQDKLDTLKGDIAGADAQARLSLLNLISELQKKEVISHLNNTGIGFFDFFEDNKNIDVAKTTANISKNSCKLANTKVTFIPQKFDNATKMDALIFATPTNIKTTRDTNNSNSIYTTDSSVIVGGLIQISGKVYEIKNKQEVK